MPQLCAVCTEIDFEALFCRPRLRDVKLGSWVDIKAKVAHCNFCRLVVASLTAETSVRRPQNLAQICLGNEEAWVHCVDQSSVDGEYSSGWLRRRQWSYHDNGIDLQSHARKHQVAERYILVIYEANSPDPAKGRIQLLTSGSGEDDRQAFLGRHVAANQVNIDLITQWYNHCQRLHGTACNDPGVLAGDLPAGFRVIDMHTNLVIPAPPHCNYVAISYCWGSKHLSRPMPVCLREDVQLDREGRAVISLDQIVQKRGKISRTISNGMTVARNLGFRYFWADSLCILQDRGPAQGELNADQKAQIEKMDAVYGAASLTIAAGSSMHADCGLQGVKEGAHDRSNLRSFTQKSAMVKGYEMAVTLPSFTELDTRMLSLVWNTRGWTLQEKIFSRRLLLFTDHQVYFRCRNASWCEDVRSEATELSKSSSRRPNPFAWIADRELLEAAPVANSPARRLLTSVTAINKKPEGWNQILKYINIVNMYIERSLTDPSDVLRAIAGVLRTLNLGPLYAGIPSINFGFLLLWPPSERQTMIARPSVRLPSWTWAAWMFRDGDWPAPPLKDQIGTNRYRALTRDSYIDIQTGNALKRPTVSNSLLCWLDKVETALHFKCEARKYTVRYPTTSSRSKHIRYEANDQRFFEIVDKSSRCIGEVMLNRKTYDTLAHVRTSFLQICTGQGFSSNPDIDYTYHNIKRYSYPLRGVIASPTDNLPVRNEQEETIKYSETCAIVHVLFVEWIDEVVARRIGVGRIIDTAWSDESPPFKVLKSRREVFLV